MRHTRSLAIHLAPCASINWRSRLSWKSIVTATMLSGFFRMTTGT